jgi:hypothetical protein
VFPCAFHRQPDGLMLDTSASGAVVFGVLGALAARGLSVFLREIFCFPELPFRLEPKLFISSVWAPVLFPDLSSAPPNSIFIGLCQSTGSTLQFFHERQYALYRFLIAYPASEVAVLARLCENAVNKPFPIHLK